MKRRKLFICSILLLIVTIIAIFYIKQTSYKNIVQYDMEIIYHEERSNDICIRLSKNGNYEMYYGAVFLCKPKEGIPTMFYGVKKRKIPKKVCNEMFSVVQQLHATRENKDFNGDPGNQTDRGYIIAIIEGKKYGYFLDEKDNYFQAQLLKVYNIFMTNIPKFRWSTKYLKQYDVNGNIIPAK